MQGFQYMRKYSIGRQVWRIIYPIAVYFLVQALAEGAALFGVIFQRMIAAGMNFSVVDPWAFTQQILNSLIAQTLPALALAAVVSFPILGLYMANDRDDRRAWGIAKPQVSGGVIALAIVLGAAACVLGNELISLSGIAELSNQYISAETMLFSSNIFVEIAVVGVLVPIAEEMLNRGLVFRRMRDYVSFWPAAILSAVLFALMHGNIVQGLYAFGVGLLMAYVYERSGRLWASILLHITANTCSVLITELPWISNRLSEDRWFYLSMAVAAVLIVVCILGIEAARKARARRGE